MAQANRRSFLTAAAALVAASASKQATAAIPDTRKDGATDFLEILRTPDQAIAYTEPFTGKKPSRAVLSRSGSTWEASGVQVRAVATADSLPLVVTAPTVPLVRIHLRWNAKPSPASLYMGDAWERSYGELAWRSIAPERVLPWYFAAHNGRTTHTTVCAPEPPHSASGR